MQQHAHRRRSALAIFLCTSLAFLVFFVLTEAAHAHAVLQTSSPAANTTVPAGVVPILLTYNSRVDAAHSSLSLLADGKTQALTINAKGAPNVLSSQTPALRSGRYLLRWQAVAADGHISRGQIAFTVK